MGIPSSDFLTPFSTGIVRILEDSAPQYLHPVDLTFIVFFHLCSKMRVCSMAATQVTDLK